MKKLTVEEYAKIYGISPQAVYKRIDKLKTIREIRNGRTITLIVIDEEQHTKSADNPVNTETTQQDSIIEMLIKQLKEKDKQIEKLHQLLAEEQRLHEQLLTQEQQLHANTQRNLLLAQGKPQEEEITQQEDIAENMEEASPQKKKGFWHRIFR